MTDPRPPIPPQFLRTADAGRCSDGRPHERVITLDERVEAMQRHATISQASHAGGRHYHIVRVGYCLDCRRHLRSETEAAPFGPWTDAAPGALDLNGQTRDRRAG